MVFHRLNSCAANCRNAGFTIIDQLGIVEMINTGRLGRIDYRDFYTGSGSTRTWTDRTFNTINLSLRHIYGITARIFSISVVVVNAVYDSG
jgi:hypothetical protein